MSSRVEECKNAKCKRPFAVSECGSMPVADWEEIDCPHCQHGYGRRASTTYFTAPLTTEQEEAYKRGELKYL
jgi:hypothetical protein